MNNALVQAQQALSAFDRQADLLHLRRAMQALSAVDLLTPAGPDERLALRAQALNGWLALVSRLDGLQAELDNPPAGDRRSVAERNRLGWQCDALDQDLSQQVTQFLGQYFTPAPVDRDELSAAMDACALPASRRLQWLPP
ncbi:hypothetical protein BurJ1DRAFT_1638 [Burkholderiales bacterium JOSHI_001]|nr:hypothetical protein BurJ1DRAFT_1638 [Burkholderiales bacterium JOSHI_001]